MIYETKGLTLEQVDELYDEVHVARHSVHWKPTTTFRTIRASMAQQGGMGAHGEKGVGHEGHGEKVEGREYRAETES
ncbi:hypothetical protein IFR04_016381 [Cadophora malorum]|uniref:Uncharacterized protein n=1 Tax=Cadophora malorum TaxID=108018 RepID=A0A8H7VYL2_9HELO|nr:hypothetical protein IFR04_016381 [Cadophora malorum]